jgi:hypothetical protein
MIAGVLPPKLIRSRSVELASFRLFAYVNHIIFCDDHNVFKKTWPHRISLDSHCKYTPLPFQHFRPKAVHAPDVLDAPIFKSPSLSCGLIREGLGRRVAFAAAVRFLN